METPEDFLKAIPNELVKNIQFRRNLHRRMASDPGMLDAYLELCRAKPQIMFNSSFWVYEARANPGFQNVPFILRPQQDIGIDRLKDAIDNGHNLVFDKSREEGASEIICKMFAAYFLLYENMFFLMGSRKEDLVDQSTDIKKGRVVGPHQCLMHKILYAITSLPPYMQPQIMKRHKFVENLDTGSAIEGEATNESFGAGNRAKAVLVDECARIEPILAQYIIDNVQDTSPCCIYNSTHFKWGSGHPYAKLINSNKVEVVTLGWEHNPVKNFGLYNSPALDEIIINDMDYYRGKCPTIFDEIEPHKSFVYSDLQLKVAQSSDEIQEQMSDISFTADGGEGNFNCPRSPWFDDQVERGRSRQDIATNVLRIPQGSADQFFDDGNLVRIEKLYVRDPDYTGNIHFKLSKTNKPVDVKFKRGGQKLLKWWGPLPKGRPRQDHNYIVSCDISRGTGASNSVATITDVNTSEEVGVYVNPNIDVTDFAELSVALCCWVGGGTKSAYLIWEGNGPGDTFRNRVRKMGYTFVYYKVDDRKKTKKRPSNKTYGWWSTTGINGTKNILLSDFDAALGESILKVKRFPYYIIHDIELVRELRDYIFMGDRIDVGLSSQTTESSGARFAHGDRAISAALVMLAMREQPKAKVKHRQKTKRNTMGNRIMDRKAQRRREAAKKKVGKWLNEMA
jgi:hypothetical protein